MKEKYDSQIAELESKNAAMKVRITDYKDDGKDKWQSFRTEFNRDMDELGNSLKNFNTTNNKK